ncbi:hypothetical protein B0H11DRAFT_2245745 [Mycena galericulata]|nr:hypothetical protein B0H11DRAFT_2245745 [Mycena galericulata]
MLISSAFRKSWQLELLFADFFASITLTIISLRIALVHMWTAWLLVLLGLIATDQSYRSIKVALKGLEVWKLQQTCAVWGFLLAVCMAFVTPSELEPDVWSFTSVFLFALRSSTFDTIVCELI